MPSWADDIQALTDLVLDWQQEHDNTGTWPIGEIAACMGFGAAVVFAVAVLVVFSHSSHWTKWQYSVCAIPLVIAVVAGGEWLKGRIRAARRVRRRAARKRELMAR